jgi:hypothetical protein
MHEASLKNEAVFDIFLFPTLALVLESAYYPRSLLTDLSLNRRPLFWCIPGEKKENPRFQFYFGKTSQQLFFFLSFFFIRLFICAYIVWAISPPYHHLPTPFSTTLEVEITLTDRRRNWVLDEMAFSRSRIHRQCYHSKAGEVRFSNILVTLFFLRSKLNDKLWSS